MIKWYHKRWFWGVMLGVLFIFSFLYYKSISDIVTGHSDNVFELLYSFIMIHLPLGIIATLSVILRISTFTLIEKLNTNTLYSLLLIIYYLAISILIYKTFRNKKVEIRYPIIIITILLLSMFGIMIGSMSS